MKKIANPKRFHPRPLLAATAGVALISLGACGGYPPGNLMAPRCDAGDTSPYCVELTADGGTPDAGRDGGTDGGTDGGI